MHRQQSKRIFEMRSFMKVVDSVRDRWRCGVNDHATRKRRVSLTSILDFSKGECRLTFLFSRLFSAYTEDRRNAMPLTRRKIVTAFLMGLCASLSREYGRIELTRGRGP